jgi:hypothetical protein
MIPLPQAERVEENVWQDMPSVIPYSQTTLTEDDISYFGTSRQAPVRVPVSSAVFHVSECILNVQTPLCPEQRNIDRCAYG